MHCGNAKIRSLLCSVLFCVQALIAQDLRPAEFILERERAGELYTSGKHAEAGKIFSRLAAANPTDGYLWFAAGFVTRSGDEEQRRAAVHSMEKAFALGYGNRNFMSIEIAKLHAGLGQQERTRHWLGVALESRLEEATTLRSQAAFRALEEDGTLLRLLGLETNSQIDELSRQAGWEFDISYLIREVRRMHASPGREGFSPEFDREASELLRRIGELSDVEVALEIQRLVVMLGDGHSFVSRNSTARVEFKTLPINFYLFADGIFIIEGKGDTADYVGARVLKFGSMEAEQVLKAIKPYVHCDNDSSFKWLVTALLRMPALLKLIGASEDPERVTLTLEIDSEEHQVTLKPGSLPWQKKLQSPAGFDGKKPLYLSSPQTHYWLQDLPDARTAYLQLNGIHDMTMPLADFAKNLSAHLEAKGTENLILDLRRNYGGNYHLSIPLVRSLIAFEVGAEGRQLYVLIGRTTFSAAQAFLAWLDVFTNPIYVGEPSGSRPNFTGETALIHLPYSGLTASASSQHHQNGLAGDQRTWIAPHVPVALNSEDYFAGIDPVMEAVLEVIAETGK